MSALPFLLHGITIALAWFVIVSIASAALVAAAAGWRSTERLAPSSGFWLALRLVPAALSTGFVALVVVPSYWRYEPRELVEGFDVTLTTLAVLGLAVIAAGAVRGFSSWRRAERRTAAWLRAARPLTLAGTSMPAFAIDTDTPVMALAGVLRPRLLIAQRVLDTLTDEELRAGVAHEVGHWRAWDNLKRLAMRAAPDLLAVTAAARTIERRWIAAAEQAADRRAGESGPARCALAAALVKVARLMPPIAAIGEPISPLVDGGDITTRVERLLEDAPPEPAHRSTRWLALAIPVAALALTYTPILRTVHAVTEVLVNRLP